MYLKETMWFFFFFAFFSLFADRQSEFKWCKLESLLQNSDQFTSRVVSVLSEGRADFD